MEKIKDKRFLVATALAAAVVVVFVLSRAAAVESVYPFDRLRVVWRTRAWPRVTGFFRAAASAAENVRLRREVAALALTQAETARVAAENARLRAALSFAAHPSGRWIPAEVLATGGGSSSVRPTVRLDKGTRDGVVADAAVVVPEGLVGRVVSVTAHTCEVLLLASAELRVACEIETASGRRMPRGILCGGGGDTLELKYLTRAGGLKPARQRVITSGLGGVFPRGIAVGFLVKEEDETWYVQPAADLSNLEFLFIRHED